MGASGAALDFDFLARDGAKRTHNPGRKKKQRAFYKDAQIIRGYRKLQKNDAAVAATGTSRDFAKASKRKADADADADADGEAVPRARKPKRRKADPFKKIVDARKATEDADRRKRDAAEAGRLDALKARKAKTKLAKKGRGGRMKAQLGDILAKLEKDR